ncbi:MAG: peptide chain release factor 2 [Spirochaetaceae bacterium 4572_7]|nr:MAG: peptide chain release factor 2 [Spirochaetaceae bacterium 4572_7]
MKKEVKELELLSGSPSFWDNREKAESQMSEMNRLKRLYEPWEDLISTMEDLKDLHELAIEESEESYFDEINKGLIALSQEYEKLTVLELMGEEADSTNAYITIHSGAGGTEACDWANMLYRMYIRWVEKSGFDYSLFELQDSEGGIKSVSFEVKGDFAYGMLKGESGIHRLVRISPFDSNARRHTSFASVYVSPVIDDTIEVDIKPDDIRVDTYRASGAGGQHINKTSSAVRLTHYESGIVVQCQNERSQLKNKELAMKVLKSRLYEYYRQIQDAKNAENAAEKREIGWGSQIRSYVFQPYRMVKDLRTRHETANIQGVMDGDLDPFIESYLRYNAGL